jgi:hypothetical protein
MEDGFGSKHPIAARDFPAAQFSGRVHLQKLWMTHDLTVSARFEKQRREKLQIQPFASIFVVEYAFASSASAIQTIFLLGIDYTLLQSAFPTQSICTRTRIRDFRQYVQAALARLRCLAFMVFSINLKTGAWFAGNWRSENNGSTKPKA